jgi:hypothetical protein
MEQTKKTPASAPQTKTSATTKDAGRVHVGGGLMRF